jgi:hypothetical protein
VERPRPRVFALLDSSPSVLEFASCKGCVLELIRERAHGTVHESFLLRSGCVVGSFFVGLENSGVLRWVIERLLR